jgi:hypothetical protein
VKIYWADCLGGAYHLAGRCGKCSSGVIFVTSSSQQSGIVLAPCLECGAKQALYVHPADHQAWALAEAVDVVPVKG